MFQTITKNLSKEVIEPIIINEDFPLYQEQFLHKVIIGSCWFVKHTPQRDASIGNCWACVRATSSTASDLPYPLQYHIQRKQKQILEIKMGIMTIKETQRTCRQLFVLLEKNHLQMPSATFEWTHSKIKQQTELLHNQIRNHNDKAETENLSQVTCPSW